ncbi:unnamed protein product [Meloidogyne enterolobii]|uniref:Uncharacterized protein n=1 Tax=Meloidogyne enterolobii TaxID=390850 RepID=A0ACB0YUY5_MELEN
MKVKERDKQITTKCLNKQKRERKGGKKNNTKNCESISSVRRMRSKNRKENWRKQQPVSLVVKEKGKESEGFPLQRGLWCLNIGARQKQPYIYKSAWVGVTNERGLKKGKKIK